MNKETGVRVDFETEKEVKEEKRKGKKRGPRSNLTRALLNRLSKSSRALEERSVRVHLMSKA